MKGWVKGLLQGLPVVLAILVVFWEADALDRGYREALVFGGIALFVLGFFARHVQDID